MLKKIFIFVAALLAIAFIANYYDVMETPSYKGKPKVLETRDDYLYKSEKIIASELK